MRDEPMSFSRFEESAVDSKVEEADLLVTSRGFFASLWGTVNGLLGTGGRTSAPTVRSGQGESRQDRKLIREDRTCLTVPTWLDVRRPECRHRRERKKRQMVERYLRKVDCAR